MNISLFNFNALAGAASKKIGEVWKPKAQSNMVGRDVMAMTSTAPTVSKQRDIVMADGDTTRMTSRDIFASAKETARQGFGVKGFRSVGLNELDQWVTRSDNYLYESDTRIVTFTGNQLNVYEKNDAGEIGKLIDSHTVTDDTRLVWDKDGNHSFLTGGAAASSNGKLKAESPNEIIVRMSDKDVEAGDLSIVVNLSDKAATFSGGSAVTYLGSYEDGFTIHGGKGTTTFAGYFNGADLLKGEGGGNFSGVFENLTLEGSDTGNDFAGYFSSVIISGGNGNNSFQGMFLAGTSITSGDRSDTFSGRFIDSTLNGGAGNDTYGAGVKFNAVIPTLETGEGSRGVESDFIGSDITAGDGDNTINASSWNSTFTLGKGNDTVKGAFSSSRLASGEGNDSIAVMYSDSSTFDSGAGTDTVNIATSRGSRIITGEGTNTVSLGVNPEDATFSTGSDYGTDSRISNTTWSNVDEYAKGLVGSRFGELQMNTVYSEVGQNVVHVNHAGGTQSVWTGDKEKLSNVVRQDRDSDQPEQSSEAYQKQSAVTASKSWRDMASGLQRYADVTGMGPEEDSAGGRAVRVVTGTGEDINIKSSYRTSADQVAKRDSSIETRLNRYDSLTHRSMPMKI